VLENGHTHRHHHQHPTAGDCAKSEPSVPILVNKSKSASIIARPTSGALAQKHLKVTAIGSDGESEELGSDEVFLHVPENVSGSGGSSSGSGSKGNHHHHASSSLTSLLFAARLHKSQSVYDASSSGGSQRDFKEPQNEAISVSYSKNSKSTSGIQSTANQEAQLIKQRHHRSMGGLRRNHSSGTSTNGTTTTTTTTAATTATTSGGAKSVIRRRQSSQNQRHNAGTNNQNAQNATSDAIDLISKRLSLPADLTLPASFVAKILKTQAEPNNGGNSKDNPQGSNGNSNPLLDDPDEPLTRKLRRQSLVSRSVCKIQLKLFLFLYTKERNWLRPSGDVYEARETGRGNLCDGVQREEYTHQSAGCPQGDTTRTRGRHPMYCN